MPRVQMPDGAVVDMPDTLTPELATRLKALQGESAGGIPDSKPMASAGAPAPKEDVGGSFFNKLPGAMNPIARAAVAYGEAGLAAATGAAAPAVGVARSMMDGKYGTQAGVREAQQTTGYQPRTEYGQTLTQKVGEIGAKVPGAEYMPALGGMTGELSALGRAVPAVGRAAGDVVAARPRMAPLPPTGSGAGRGNGILATLKGEPSAATRVEASQSARQALTEAEKLHGTEQASHLAEANTYEDLRTALQRDIDAGAQAGSRPHLGKQGETIDAAVNTAFKLADEARSEATSKLYAERDAAVAKFDASGKRLDVKPVVEPIKELIPFLENIPDKKATFTKILNSIEGTTPKVEVPAPLGKGKVSGKMTAPAPVMTKEPLSVRELVEADKFVKEIAFSAPTEGYGADVRKAAMDVHKRLDAALGEAIPEHRKASNEYRRLSKPLETASTRFGDLITETVGGIGKDAYSKFDKTKLPQQIFTNTNYVDMLEDALAGGKGTTGPAREMARKQVSSMYENWLMETIRGGETGKTGQGALSRLEDKNLRPMTERFPEVKSAASRTFQGEVAKEKSMKELAASAEQSRAKAATSASEREKVNGLLRSADELAKGDAKQQRAAFNDYSQMLKSKVAAGELPPELFRATLKLAARAESEQARTDIMRKVAWTVAGFAGLGGAKVAAPMVFGGDSK